MQWMLWTLPTACFFIAIAVLLIGMTLWEVISPNVPRRGWVIPMQTTRGDRLFIALLTSAYVCAFWVAVVPASMWWMIPVTIFLLVILQIWG